MARKKKKRNPVKEEVKIKKKISSKLMINSLGIKQFAAIFSVFIVCSFLLYQACIDYGFVLDDKIVLSENNYTKKGFAGIPDLFSTDSFQGYFGEQKEILQGGRYRPLSLVSFAIEHEFFGLDHRVYHITNILLYAIAAFVCFICLRRLFREDDNSTDKLLISVSLLSSLLFLFHPIHTEAVANIKGRDEIMSMLFSMMSLLFALRYYDTNKITQLITALLFYFLGLFSKENTITFLAIIPLSIILFRKFDLKKFSIGVGAFFISTIVYLLIRIQALGYFLIDNPSTDIMNNPFTGLSVIEKFSTIFYILLVYLKLIFVPIELTHDYYPYHIPIMDASDWQVWLSIIIHLSLAGAAILLYKKRKLLSFAIGFYLIALSIISNIVVNVGTFMNERFIFAASLGMCILSILILRAVADKLKFMPAMYRTLTLVIILAALYSFKTIDRVPAWESELALNEAAIKVSKNSARANSFLATAYFNRYKQISDSEEKRELIRKARPYAEKALSIYPEYYNGNLMMAGIAAEEFKYDRDFDKLLNNFMEVAKVRPDVDFLTTYLKYLNGRGDNLDDLKQFYIKLGKNELLDHQKNYNWAIHYLLLGDSISPNDPVIRASLVSAYQAIGRQDLANKYR